MTELSFSSKEKKNGSMDKALALNISTNPLGPRHKCQTTCPCPSPRLCPFPRSFPCPCPTLVQALPRPYLIPAAAPGPAPSPAPVPALALVGSNGENCCHFPPVIGPSLPGMRGAAPCPGYLGLPGPRSGVLLAWSAEVAQLAGVWSHTWVSTVSTHCSLLQAHISAHCR